MSRRFRALLVLILTLITPLVGCWSRQEIEFGGFASLVAIDKAEDDGIELTYSLAITESSAGGEGGGGSDVPAWTVSSSGKNIAEAIANSRTFSGRVPFWFHAQALIIGEDLAKEGIEPILDYALRTRDFRLSTPVFVAEGKAKDILDINPKITKLPGRYLQNLVYAARESSVAHEQGLLNVIKKLVAGPGEEFYVPLIKPKPKDEQEGKKGADSTSGEESGGGGEKPDEKPEALVLEGSAIFADDRMVGKLNGIETRGMLWLRGESQRATVVVNTPEGTVVQQQIYARRTLHLRKDEELLRAVINVFQDGDVIEHNMPQHPELNAAALEEMDAALTATIQAEVEAALQRLQQDLRADTLGIGKRVYHLYPELFNSLDWRQVFPDIPVEVNVHANFRRTGESAQSPLVR